MKGRALPADVAQYMSLLRSFYSGEISIPEFETAYFRLFKAEKRLFEQPLYEILNGVFTALDSHVEDGIKTWAFELSTDELTSELKLHYRELIHYLSLE